MSSKSIYVASQFAGLVPALRRLLPGVDVKEYTFKNAVPGQASWHLRAVDEDFAALEDAEIIVAENGMMADFAFRLPKLKWLQGTFAGVNIPFERLDEDLKAGRIPNFIATRFTGDAYGKCMFEYCLAFMISKERGFREHQALQPTKDWAEMKAQTPRNARFVDELTVSIVGLGSIGIVLSQFFKKMGCKVLAYSRSQKSEEVLKEAQVDSFSTDVLDVLRETDYIVSILPHTPETIGFLSNKLAACTTKPVFINLGRGSVLPGPEIIEALDAGYISRAVLDVYEQEPLPVESPLWSHPNVVMTPHMGAETRPNDLAAVVADNYRRYLAGEELKFKIDWVKGY